MIPDAVVSDVHGVRNLKRVVLASASGGARLTQLDCDLVCMSGGWSPAVHLTSHGGIKPRYRAEIAAFVAGGYAQGHSAPVPSRAHAQCRRPSPRERKRAEAQPPMPASKYPPLPHAA